MNYVNHIIKWTLPVALGVAIICFAVLFSLGFKGLYYWDINHLSISEDTHLDDGEIRDNYDVLIEYLTNKQVDQLILPSFHMSVEGEIHFVDVKNIFMMFQRVMYILGGYSIIGILFSMIKKQYYFLKHTAIAMIVGPLGILLAAMINFDRAFVIFHNIAFSNDYWIFDPIKDPIITILPQEFFLHSFLFIIGIVVISAFILMAIYIHMNKGQRTVS